MNRQAAIENILKRREQLPKHVAFIMDGNGRWAAARGLTRSDGHEAGVNNIRPILDVCRELEIPYITLFAFSTENWNRPKVEVDTLMLLLRAFIERETDDLIKNKIRIRFLGRTDRVPEEVLRSMEWAAKATADGHKFTFNVCIDYGGRDEIVQGVRRLAETARAPGFDPESVTPEMFSEYLYTAGMPDPDLLIRTSGEQRISNFLLWQIAYAELLFHPKHWPEFTPADFAACLENYCNRERRFGKI